MSETSEMSDYDRGLDPNSLTGTKGAVDPETGAFGTAGTPVTTGIGMSGSTIGLGHHAERELWKDGNFEGATPNSHSYQHGGQFSEEARNERARSFSQRRDLDPASRSFLIEGGVQPDGEPNLPPMEIADMYEYDEELERGDLPADFRVLPEDDIYASSGTDLTGDMDIRGLGDNTDTPN